MVFEVKSGRPYIYQPEQKIITYSGRSSRATVSEFVVFRQITEEGLYQFERRDGSVFTLMSLKYVFEYLQYVKPKFQ